MKANSRLWLTWEHHRRSESLSAEIGAEYAVVGSRLPRLGRYLFCAVRTLLLLLRQKPSLVIGQSPSIFLGLLCVLWGRVAGVSVVIDAHNAGVLPLEGRSRLLQFIVAMTLRNAALTIVTTEALADRVRQIGGRPFVLMDPLPKKIIEARRRMQPTELSREPKIVCITTWAEDEPVREILHAGAILPGSWTLYFTGRPPTWIRNARTSANIKLTGFLPECEYLDLLLKASCVVDLTTRENCLVCGAYEAIAAGRPLLLSDTIALRAGFGQAAEFTQNRPEEIAAVIQQIIVGSDKLLERSAAFATEYVRAWNEKRLDLERELTTLPH